MLSDPSPTASGAPPLGVASLPQLLTGTAISEAATYPCSVCGTSMSVGDVVFAYAGRRQDCSRWLVRRVYCWGCAPKQIISPSPGVAEAIVGGRIGTRTDPTPRVSQLCLTELAVRDFSPPEEY